MVCVVEILKPTFGSRDKIAGSLVEGTLLRAERPRSGRILFLAWCVWWTIKGQFLSEFEQLWLLYHSFKSNWSENFLLQTPTDIITGNDNSISIHFGPLGFSRWLGDGKLPFSFFVLIFSRRWHTAMNPPSHTRGREELHHPPRQFQPRRQIKHPMLPLNMKSKWSLKGFVNVIWSCAVLLPTKRWSRCGECGSM